MHKAFAIVPLAFAILTSHEARGDVISSGEKRVKLTIRVEADVPTGQTLLLGNTFRAIDVIQPGKVAPVEWHPLGGSLQIVAVPSSSVMANVEELRQNLDRRALKAVFTQGKPCHEAFDGFRTVPITAPADEIRWNYKVTFAGNACTAMLVSMEFFDKAGKAVTGADVADLPLGVPGVPSNSPRTPKDPHPDPTPEPIAGSEPVAKGACGCEVGPGAADSEMASIVETWGPLGSVAMAGLVLAFRRRSNRGTKK